MNLTDIQKTLVQCEREAGNIARSAPESEQIRILAISIAETARAVGDLSQLVGRL